MPCPLYPRGVRAPRRSGNVTPRQIADLPGVHELAGLEDRGVEAVVEPDADADAGAHRRKGQSRQRRIVTQVGCGEPAADAAVGFLLSLLQQALLCPHLQVVG